MGGPTRAIGDLRRVTPFPEGRTGETGLAVVLGIWIGHGGIGASGKGVEDPCELGRSSQQRRMTSLHFDRLNTEANP
jgi:hypothetical protein